MRRLESCTSVMNEKRQKITKQKEYGKFEKVFREERRKLENGSISGQSGRNVRPNV